jgi:hypothetical protein
MPLIPLSVLGLGRLSSKVDLVAFNLGVDISLGGCEDGCGDCHGDRCDGRCGGSTTILGAGFFSAMGFEEDTPLIVL